MKLKDINKTQLSALTGIPATTLNRIINGTVINVKTAYMETIAKALGTTIYNLFDLPELNQPLITALRPEEAGTVVEKLLSEEESLLLYWFQNSSQDSRASILMKARNEYYVTKSCQSANLLWLKQRITIKLNSILSIRISRVLFICCISRTAKTRLSSL